MQLIRFPSVLNPSKLGYEFTNDDKFWDTSYHHGGVLHVSAGFYETYGDGNTQHTPLMACGAEHFTDYCISLVRYLLDHPETEIKTYSIGLPVIKLETVKFLATLVHKDDKAQWYNLADDKVSTSKAKQYDKRWTLVPDWANGTIASALSLYCLPSRQTATSEILPRYALQEFFHDNLIVNTSTGFDEWDKLTKYREEIPGDHRSAFRALEAVILARTKLEYATRALDCAMQNTQLAKEQAESAATTTTEQAAEVAA